MSPRVSRLAGAVTLAIAASGCVGTGEGDIRGPVHVLVCNLNGSVFDLHPTFFGANRDGVALTIRIQNGGGVAEYSDGLWLTIDDTQQVIDRIAASTDRDAAGHPVATFPVGMRGDPGVIVHATLTLDWTCGRRKVTRLGQNVGLWAYEGSVTFRAIDNGPGATPERLTDVTDMHLRLHDPRAVGPNAPFGVAATAPVGEAEMDGHFSFRYSQRVPAQIFP